MDSINRNLYLPGAANNYRLVANERLDQDRFDVRLDQRFGNLRLWRR